MKKEITMDKLNEKYHFWYWSSQIFSILLSLLILLAIFNILSVKFFIIFTVIVSVFAVFSFFKWRNSYQNIINRLLEDIEELRKKSLFPDE